MDEQRYRIIRSSDPDENLSVTHIQGNIPVHLETFSSASWPEVATALEQANIGLIEAKMYYEDGGIREAFRCALLTAVDLFRAVGAPSEQLLPLTRLEGALDDLDRGARDQALAVAKRNGKPPDSVIAWTRRAHLAFALEIELALGKQMPMAVKALEKHIASLRKGSLSKKSDVDTLESWHRKFVAKEIHGKAQMVFNTSIKVLNFRLQATKPEDRVPLMHAFRASAITQAEQLMPDLRSNRAG